VDATALHDEILDCDLDVAVDALDEKGGLPRPVGHPDLGDRLVGFPARPPAHASDARRVVDRERLDQREHAGRELADPLAATVENRLEQLVIVARRAIAAGRLRRCGRHRE
jgi:hypothetical protein